MDGLKYTAICGRKESGFENLKTRFQDCNLSRKQGSKPDGMIERKQSFNRESKQPAKKARKKTIRLCRIIAVIPAFMLSVWNERKPSVKLYGWKTIMMYQNKEVLQ